MARLWREVECPYFVNVPIHIMSGADGGYRVIEILLKAFVTTMKMVIKSHDDYFAADYWYRIR